MMKQIKENLIKKYRVKNDKNVLYLFVGENEAMKLERAFDLRHEINILHEIILPLNK